jgi:hypothetical protein
VTEGPPLEVDAVTQKARQGPQVPPRQLREQPAGDRVHAHRIDGEGASRVEAPRPVPQEGELEAREVDGGGHGRGRGRGRGQARAQPLPGLLGAEGIREQALVKPGELPDDRRHASSLRQGDPVRVRGGRRAHLARPGHAPPELEDGALLGRRPGRLAVDDQDVQIQDGGLEPLRALHALSLDDPPAFNKPSTAARPPGPTPGARPGGAARLAERGSRPLAERGSRPLAERGSRPLAERGSRSLRDTLPGCGGLFDAGGRRSRWSR